MQVETIQKKNKVKIHIYDIVVISRICKKLQVNILRDKVQDKTWPKALNRNFINENIQTAKEHIHFIRISNSYENAHLNKIKIIKQALKWQK